MRCGLASDVYVGSLCHHYSFLTLYQAFRGFLKNEWGIVLVAG
tara:strand:+ start:307 stop:435 length:129 start_codon:yes stop_codon:yes gene_type:complete